MNETAFQDRMPHNHCWGCGANNEAGLQLKSFWSGDEAVADWTPSDAHAAGPRHILNGGVIATLLDCHSICTAIADAYRLDGRDLGEGQPIWFVTASLDVKYSAPTPIEAPVHLCARVIERVGKKTKLFTELSSSGEVRASCDVLAIRVAQEWLMRDS